MSQGKALPLGWKWVKLKELCEVVTGTTPSKNNSEYYSNEFPFYKPTDLEAGENVIFSRDSLSGLGIKAARYVPEGSTLVTCIGATIGKTGFIKKGGAFNQQINAIIPSNNFHPKFIYYQTISPHFQKQIKDNASSTTLPIINKGKFEVLSIVFPPLSIQTQIVEKLEALLSELDKGKTQLLTAQAQLKTYRQAVLKYAFEGKLTGDMEGWQWVKLGTVFNGTPQNGIYKPSTEYGQGFPIMRIDGFYDGIILSDYAYKRLRLNKDEISKYSLDIGDLLVNRVNSLPYLGKCGLVNKLRETTVFESNIMRIKLDNNKVLPQYISTFLSSRKGLIELRKNAKHAVNQASINQTDVSNVIIPFPPLSTQQKIVTEIESRLSVCDKLEETLKVSLEQCETLRQSLLKRAFEGRLV